MKAGVPATQHYENVMTNKKLQLVKLLWVWFRVFMCPVTSASFSKSHERLLKGSSFHNPSLTQDGYPMHSVHNNFAAHQEKGSVHLPVMGNASETYFVTLFMNTFPPPVRYLLQNKGTPCMQKQPGDRQELSEHRLHILVILLSDRKLTHVLF